LLNALERYRCASQALELRMGPVEASRSYELSGVALNVVGMG